MQLHWPRYPHHAPKIEPALFPKLIFISFLLPHLLAFHLPHINHPQPSLMFTVTQLVVLTSQQPLRSFKSARAICSVAAVIWGRCQECCYLSHSQEAPGDKIPSAPGRKESLHGWSHSFTFIHDSEGWSKIAIRKWTHTNQDALWGKHLCLSLDLWSGVFIKYPCCEIPAVAQSLLKQKLHSL